MSGNQTPTERSQKFNLTEEDRLKFKKAYRNMTPIYKNRQRSKYSKYVAYTIFAGIGGVTAVGLAMDSVDFVIFKIGTALGYQMQNPKKIPKY
jgi:hypothetical protein